jgi:acyl-CoA reductase-like NAD-dependent aldehyde dehydrogenase
VNAVVHELLNPATAEPITTVELATAEEVDAAVLRARGAFDTWRHVSPADRARLLRRFAAAVDAHRDELALIDVANAGHTITSARAEADNVRDVLDYYAGAPERLLGQQIPVADGLDITFKEPLGVVGVIAPWNFPMPIAAWGLAPALAAGNTVVLKPATETPLSAMRLAQLASEAGLPDNVLQTVVGSGIIAGRRLVEHPDVRKIVFTGSTAVGKQVLAACAEHVKRVTLELGGKSANVVFADADVELAAAMAPSAAFDNAGQDCCARSRILVEASTYERFLELLEKAVLNWRVGDPTDEHTQMGPLISAAHRGRVAAYAGSAPDVLQGNAPAGPGFWFPATIVGDVAPDHPVCQEEIFGPVAVVLPFADEQDAVRLANDTPYGLSGSIWTRDAGRAVRVARAVESGNLSVNSNLSVRYATPFGGFKQSGLGRELGPLALDAFTEVKNVFLATGA